MSVHVGSLDEIVKYAQGAFIHAKSDGVLEAGEVVQIAVGVAGKLHGLGQLSGSEKKAVVMYCLKKGLDAAGGVGELPGLRGVAPEMRKAMEGQLLAAAGAAIDMAVAVAHGKIDLTKDLLKPKTCLPLCLSAASVVQALLPKEAGIVKNALAWAEEHGKAYAAAQGLVPAAPVETPVAIQESAAAGVTPAPAPSPEPAQDSSPATESQKEPSPEASAEGAPVHTHEVRFE
jgi:hypothetical protein